MYTYKKIYLLLFGVFLNLKEVFTVERIKRSGVYKFLDIIDPICNLPVDSGLCTEIILKYYYNNDMDECQEFIYTGCGGNENRFVSKKDCDSFCSSKFNGVISDTELIQPPTLSKYEKQPRCLLPFDTGKCRAIKKRFYYNTKSDNCETFIYGGCGGNKNNFKTLPECLDACT